MWVRHRICNVTGNLNRDKLRIRLVGRQRGSSDSGSQQELHFRGKIKWHHNDSFSSGLPVRWVDGITVTSLPSTPANSNQGIAWGLSRPQDTSSQPQDSQDNDIVFDHKVRSVSKWSQWERPFVLWIQQWNADASKWKLKAVEKTGIGREDFYKEFTQTCKVCQPHHTQSPISEFLGVLSLSYSWYPSDPFLVLALFCVY